MLLFHSPLIQTVLFTLVTQKHHTAHTWSGTQQVTQERSTLCVFSKLAAAQIQNLHSWFVMVRCKKVGWSQHTVTSMHQFQTKEASILVSLQSRQNQSSSVFFHPEISSYGIDGLQMLPILLAGAKDPKEFSNHSTKHFPGSLHKRPFSNVELSPYPFNVFGFLTPFQFLLSQVLPLKDPFHLTRMPLLQDMNDLFLKKRFL